MGSASREQMEKALAESFGYPDYPSFREGVSQTLGKSVLKQLERRLGKMEADEKKK